MKLLKKMMQVALTAFFFGLLATNTVFADTTGGQFVDKDNRKYFVKDDHKAIYWHKIDGKTYYFGDSGEMVVGWQYLEIPGTGYRDNLLDNQPVNEIGLQHKWYYFDKDGVLQEFVGWQQLEAKDSLNVGKKHGEGFEGPEVLKLANYYFDQDHSLKTGWLYDQSNWYYLAKTGSSGRDYLGGERRAGWINDNSTWYYLDTTTAAMQTGWQYLGNKWYYLRSSGAMATGWYLDGSTWYYLDAQNGDMKTSWIYVGNTWYYLRSSGAMVTGWLQDGSTWYYLNASNGDMKTGWAYVGNKWYYLRSSGAMATGWYQDGSTWYYLDEPNGDMKTGWQYLGNKWYYLRSSGAMATGWYQDGSTWYYLNASNGDMKTGWFQVNGKWYYAYSSGALAVNTTVGGYYVNYNGEWVQ